MERESLENKGIERYQVSIRFESEGEFSRVFCFCVIFGKNGARICEIAF